MAQAGVRNADWSRDETILLLDLYLRHLEAEARYPEGAALLELRRDLARTDGSWSRSHPSSGRDPGPESPPCAGGAVIARTIVLSIICTLSGTASLALRTSRIVSQSPASVQRRNWR